MRVLFFLVSQPPFFFLPPSLSFLSIPPSSSSPNPSLLPAEILTRNKLVSEPVVFGLRLMAPETRSQDVRRMEESLEAVNRRINGMEAKLDALSDDMTQLKAIVK